MKKIIRLTESDLTRIVKRVIEEQINVTNVQGMLPKPNPQLNIPQLDPNLKNKLLTKLSTIKSTISEIFNRTYDKTNDKDDIVKTATLTLLDDITKKINLPGFTSNNEIQFDRVITRGNYKDRLSPSNGRITSLNVDQVYALFAFVSQLNKLIQTQQDEFISYANRNMLDNFLRAERNFETFKPTSNLPKLPTKKATPISNDISYDLM